MNTPGKMFILKIKSATGIFASRRYRDIADKIAEESGPDEVDFVRTLDFPAQLDNQVFASYYRMFYDKEAGITFAD